MRKEMVQYFLKYESKLLDWACVGPNLTCKIINNYILTTTYSTFFHKLKLLSYNIAKCLDTIRPWYSYFIMCSIFMLFIQIKSEIFPIFYFRQKSLLGFPMKLAASNIGHQRQQCTCRFFCASLESGNCLN